MPRHPRIPTYRLHKPTGQAVVTINGKDFYLGKHDSPKSHAAYKRLIAEWLANHQLEIGPSSSTRTVNEILLRIFATLSNTTASTASQPNNSLAFRQLSVRFENFMGHRLQLNSVPWPSKLFARSGKNDRLHAAPTSTYRRDPHPQAASSPA